MSSSTILSSIASTTTSLAASATSTDAPNEPTRKHHSNEVIAFIIGLSIVILASILNAAGLNLTKLDHVRTSAMPKASRPKDWLRPLWLLGMLLYILSQLIGSTLALEYLRAEYVAPLGSTSLIFNFLFARFLVGTPVTATDISGTVVVLLGVVGIVAFGSINSGLTQDTDAARLAALWSRPGWIGFLAIVVAALGAVLIFATALDAVLASRADLSAVPFAGMRIPPPRDGAGLWTRMGASWALGMVKIKEKLEQWTAPKDDKQIAWTLGIGWACSGGALAGLCLVFAKATVKLTSLGLSHNNTGSQLAHPASIITLVFLSLTAVSQIICLNRGLRAYDSTLVVPVFYGVYTALGFLAALVFNDEVDAYKPWALALVAVAMLVLVAGVVLLTHKREGKPKPHGAAGTNGGEVSMSAVPARKRNARTRGKGATEEDAEEGEDEALRTSEEGTHEEDGPVVWQVGDVSDDEDGEHDAPKASGSGSQERVGGGASRGVGDAYAGREEGRGLMDEHDDEQDHEHVSEQERAMRGHRRSNSSDATIAVGPGNAEDADEFGEWKSGGHDDA